MHRYMTIAREEKYAAKRESPLSQSGRQLSAHRDLVDPFRASHLYHRIWFHGRMDCSKGIFCSPIASIDLLARDLRQIIEGPAITENSGPVSDKKMSSSIYVGGWLWEGFREVRQIHLKQQQEEEEQRQQVKALQEATAKRKRSLSNHQLDHHHPQPAAATVTLHSGASSLLINPPPMAAQAAYGFMNGFPVPVAAMTPAYYSSQMMGQYRPPPPVFMGQQIHAAPTGTSAGPPY